MQKSFSSYSGKQTSFNTSMKNSWISFGMGIFILVWDCFILSSDPFQILLTHPLGEALTILCQSIEKLLAVVFFSIGLIIFNLLLPFLLSAPLMSIIPFLRNSQFVISSRGMKIEGDWYSWNEIVAVKKAFFEVSDDGGFTPANPVLLVEISHPVKVPPLTKYWLRAISNQLGTLNSECTLVVNMFAYTYEKRQQILALISQHIQVQESEFVLKIPKDGLLNQKTEAFDEDDGV